MNRKNKRHLSFMPIPVLIIFMAAIYLTLEPFSFFEPTWLLPILNTVFITLISLIVSYIALRNYKATGRLQVLLLGCGVLAFGIGAMVAGFLRSVPGVGANLNVTIFNVGALMAAIFHFVAALILLAGISPEVGSKRKTLWLILSYAGLTIFMTLLTIASLRGIIPPFFIQGVGPTILRQGVLGTATVLFTFSFLILMGSYLRNREVFLYWYASALALIAIGLTAVFIQKAVGSPIGWAGRFAQYIGGVYFLIAIITTIRSAHARRISFENVLSASLTPGEEKFRALAENSPDVIDRFDREMKHIYVNAAGLRLYGKPAASVIGKTIEETELPETYCSLLKERVQKVFKTGEPVEVEEYFPAKHGREFYQSRFVPEYGPDGTVANVLVVSRDLTGRKRVEDVLRESETKYRIVSNNTYDWEFWLDAQGRFVYISPSCQRITGYEAEQFINDTNLLDRLIHPEDRSFFANHRHEAEQKIESGEIEFRIIHQDGTTRWIGHVCQPVFDDSGTFLGTRGSNRDITERKKAEEEVKKLNEKLRYNVVRLEEANKELEAFSYSVSHDLRAPLRAISGFSQVLLEDYIDKLDDEGRRVLNIIERNTQKMGQLIDDLLVFSRLGRQEIRVSEINMTRLSETAFEELKATVPERKLRFNTEPLPPAQGDPAMIKQVFSNLFSNAVKFTRPKETALIEVEARTEGGENIYFVRDNGVGFDMQYADKLFGVFQRLHSSEEFEGTGVGLAIVQRIIHRHGGRVWAEGKVGEGATFYFSLPRK